MMYMALILASTKMMKKINPLNMSFVVLVVSITMSLLMFKMTLSSWLPLVTIITFSAGMMTLFVYISSVSPNEKSKSKMLWAFPVILTAAAKTPKTEVKTSKKSMKIFTNQFLMLTMMIVLILAILAISKQTYNPSQSMTSTF